jgi:hypothetical protein
MKLCRFQDLFEKYFPDTLHTNDFMEGEKQEMDYAN